MSLDHLELPLSNTTLTATEASGGVCPSYFGSRRQHPVPADWAPAWTRFCEPNRPAPKPSARRAAPRSGPPLAAA